MKKKRQNNWIRFNSRLLNKIESSDDKDSYTVYQNKFNEIRIFYRYKEYVSPEVRSMRRLSRKLYNYAYKWKRFLTLTYDDKNLERVLKNNMSFGQDFSLFMNKLRNHTNRYLRWWGKGKITEFKQKFLIPLGYKHKIYGKLDYAMKYEIESSSSRDFNPHFHILLSNGYDWKYLESTWKHGFVYITDFDNKVKAIQYITKYMSKESEIQIPAGVRKFSTSANIKRHKTKFRKAFTYNIRKNELINNVVSWNLDLKILDNFY